MYVNLLYAMSDIIFVFIVTFMTFVKKKLKKIYIKYKWLHLWKNMKKKSLYGFNFLYPA